MTWPREAASQLGIDAMSGRDHGEDEAPARNGPSGSDLLGLGAGLAFAFVLPLLAGVGVDAWLHTSPLGVLVGLLLGITAACYAAFVRFRRYA